MAASKDGRAWFYYDLTLFIIEWLILTSHERSHNTMEVPCPYCHPGQQGAILHRYSLLRMGPLIHVLASSQNTSMAWLRCRRHGRF